jgi:hypothetical protein
MNGMLCDFKIKTRAGEFEPSRIILKSKKRMKEKQ